MLTKDDKLRHERGYVHPKTFVRNDGSEVLHGEEWKQRKDELAQRSGGRCEFEAPWKVWPWGARPLERCTAEAKIPAHIIPRYPRRDDRLTNLMHYCLTHDRMTEKQSWRRLRFGEEKRANGTL